jgi:hypothetical protein
LLKDPVHGEILVGHAAKIQRHPNLIPIPDGNVKARRAFGSVWDDSVRNPSSRAAVYVVVVVVLQLVGWSGFGVAR